MADPAPRLDHVLAELLTRAGARTARVVDGRTGTVVAAVGEAGSGPDGPAEVARLLRDAVATGAGAGGLDDVLVATERSVHVFRPAPVPGVFVHLRLDAERADPVRARRAVADPALQDAVRRAVGSATGSPTPSVVPQPRPARPASSGPAVPHPRPPAPQQPALAVLVAERVRTGDGVRAAIAIAELSRSRTGTMALPRRRTPGEGRRPAASRTGGVTTGLPERAWARDLETMRRLAAGLRRLH
ncbi:hypothetical protein ACVGOW_15670 [Pseudonocardia saturnea]